MKVNNGNGRITMIVDNAIWERCPGMKLVVVTGSDIDNGQSHTVEKFVREAEATAREHLAGIALAEYGPIAAWRTIMPGSQFRPAHEALLRRILTGKPLPCIGALVDFYNACSVTACVPVGGWDADALAGSVLRLFVTRGGEPFTELGSQNSVPSGGGEIAYGDAEVLVTRHFVWRQAERGKITDATRTFILISEVLPVVGEQAADKILNLLVVGLRELFGVTARSTIMEAGCTIWTPGA